MEQQEKVKASEIAHIEQEERMNNLEILQLRSRIQQQERKVEEIESTVSELECSIPKQYPPVDLVMTDFDTHKEEEDQWFSEPFYTHPGGYKMCLSVFANGTGKGKDTDVSVFANLMCGEYGDYLNWPFRGKVVVQLTVDDEEYEETFKFNSRSPAKACNRVTVGERHEFGQGCSEFISVDDVTEADAECLCFKVVSVECDS